MDPRAQRTVDALRDAVISLASERPIDDITAVELVAAAGVTRRTLYNHTENPQAFLVAQMKPELDEIREHFDARLADGVPVREAWRAGDEELLAHVLRWADVYTAGMASTADHISPSLSAMLTTAFVGGVNEVLNERTPGDPDNAVISRFIGHGVVGALEVWLMSPERDPKHLTDVMLRTVPEWILGDD